jgi:hypothetical protein
MLELVNNTTTDKNTCHSYIHVYEKLMAAKRESCVNVLEIGVQAGGSIQLWRDYFTQADVWGLDIEDTLNHIHADLRTDPRVHLSLGTDAYTTEVVEGFHGTSFDFIIDDGPHTLESMLFFVKNYSGLLTEDGCLIIEDIPDIEWIKKIYDATPEELKKFCSWADLRHERNRWDNIMFIIKKAT